LSAGTLNPDGSVTLTPEQLVGLTITPPPDSTEDFTLIVTATSTDDTDTASTTAFLPVTVAGEDTLTLAVEPASGDEDTAIALDISTALSDGSEVLTVTISAIPDGAALSAGTLNQDGSVTLTPDQLDGLTILPPADSDVDFALVITAIPADGGDVATASLEVSVAAVADAPSLSVEPASGGQETPHHDDDGHDDDGHDDDEDSAISLQIAAALTDTDGSESLSVTISGIPAGAILSAGILNLDGSVTLTPEQLVGLTILPPEDNTEDFTLIVTATSVDGSDTASTTTLLPVTVAEDSGVVLVHSDDGSKSENQNYVLVSDMDADSVTVVAAGDLSGDSSPDLWRVEENGETRAATDDDFDGAQFASVDQGDKNDWVAAAAGVEEDLVIDLSEGAWTSTEFAAGGAGDDTLTGNSARNLLIGGDGDDTFFGSENRDILLGGAGDDTFIINADALTDGVLDQKVKIGDLSQDVQDAIAANDSDGVEISSKMRSGIDGGSGNDTLRIVADEDVTIDLGSGDFRELSGAVDNIEAIDLRQGDGDITLRLDLDDVIDLTDDANELRVFRDAGDQVQISDDAVASEIGAEVEGFVTFTFLDDSGSELAKVHVQVDPPAM
jgi:hypothetical protein